MHRSTALSGKEQVPASGCRDFDDSATVSLPAESYTAGSTRKSETALPVNLVLPKKRMGVPLPSLKCLMGAAVLQCIASISGAFSAASAKTDAPGGFTPSQREDLRRTLEPGDIILSRTPANQLYYLLQKATFGSSYSHAAMYAGDNSIIDAYESVKSQGIEEFCAGQTEIVIMRPQYGSEQEREAAVEYLRSQLGKPYDWRFDTSDDSAHYCTEIVLRALEASTPGINVPGRWVLGKPVAIPDDFARAEGIERVKTYTVM
jgi:uncharacterized protein YycO